VAEDNLINQMLLQMMLEALGYGCDMANNGREVLVAIEKKAYDLILMDVEMPEMDGIEASRAVRLRVGQQDATADRCGHGACADRQPRTSSLPRA
jgi:CheY-like chemotaxis protein